MPGYFTGTDGDLEKTYVTDYAMIDQYAKTGSLWLWGYNTYGQLGDNTTTTKSSPVQTVAGGTNWKQLTQAYWSTIAIKTDGTLWTWGRNNYGQLGTNNTTTQSSPVQTVSAGTNWKQVVGGRHHVAAIKTDGTLWLWGQGVIGQLGDNTTVNKSSPVQTVSGGNNWRLVSACGYQTGAIKTDGTLWGWGINYQGNLGNNNTTWMSSPVQTVSAGTDWKLISCGHYHTTAIKTDGSLWTWGTNSYGSLGDGTVTHRSSPVQTVSAGNNWKFVSAAQYYTAAIKTDGTLWTWGRNNYGQLGDNTSGTGTEKSSPVQTVAGGTNWKQVSIVSEAVTMGIKTDGTLWAWGQNNQGQLGTGNVTFSSSPAQTIAGGTNWKQITTGNSYLTASAIYFYDAGNIYPSA